MDKSASKQKVFEEMRDLLSLSQKSDDRTLKTLDRVESLLRTNLAKIQRMYRDAMFLGTQKTESPQAKSSEAKVTPASTITPQIAPVQIPAEQEAAPQYNVMPDDIPTPGKKQTPPTTKTNPTSSPVSRLGTVAKFGALGTAAAALGGLVALGFNKKSQLPETEQEAAERGVGLSKENQIFSEKPQGLAQVLDQPEFVAQTRRAKQIETERKMQEAADTGPAKPNVVRQEQRRQEATQPQNFRLASEKMAAAGYTSIPSRARTKAEVTEQKTNNVIMIADEPFLEGKELSSKQMAAIEVSKQMGNTYPPQVEAQYTKQKDRVSAVPSQPGSDTVRGVTPKVDISSDDARSDTVRGVTPKVDISSDDARSDIVTTKNITAVNQRATEVQNEIMRSSSENRELSREISGGSTQPVVIQNNNNMSSQNFVPIQAQPRISSSFSQFQQRNAAY